MHRYITCLILKSVPSKVLEKIKSVTDTPQINAINFGRIFGSNRGLKKKIVVKIPVRIIIFSDLIFFAILDYNVSDSFLE